MFRSLSFFVGIFAAIAVSASAGGLTGKTPAVQSTPFLELAAKKGSGGGRASFSCQGLQCTCQGVEDCNDMFTSGKCGDIASCDDDTDICKCLILKKSPVKNPKLPKAPLLKVQ